MKTLSRLLHKLMGATLVGALFSFSQIVTAADLLIVAGGGYKKPMQAVIHDYQKNSGKAVDASYGNMRQILAQAKASGKIALVVGDEKFLNQTDLFSAYQPIGKGKLVIAWAKGSPAIKTTKDLTNPEISRIAHPHAKKAIYGRAAIEWLTSNKLQNPLSEVLMQASTVPQVSSYLVAREVDAGFINLTDAIGLGDRIGGYTLLDSGYSPIKIVAGTLKGHENNLELKAFKAFLQSEQAKTLFTQFGL
ncbi:molybdate ABC transporter substrate-binding protein [Thiomicrorhabdus indica]|uniref:molybdate ABC transporter substrate-binding protein n=1 Tax=Thiomicrorhabdus indica TaxID=2267253 RepID=UPI00102DD218|nr:molybdate ABC transporter substrate-binding protein [Thiomicrorhabdus indica]